MMRKYLIFFCTMLMACQAQNPAPQEADSQASSGLYNSAYAIEAPRHTLAQIQARVKAAYGGEALTELTSIRIQTDRGLAWPGQGQTHDFVEYVSDKFDVQIDLENQRASVERLMQQNGNAYHSRTVSMPAGGVAWIDYNSGTYQHSEESAFLRTFGIEITGSDTLIARALVMDPHETRIETPAFYLGKWHDRVTFTIRPEGFPGTAYIEQDTGRIVRFEVVLRDGTWNAIFSDFRKKDGLLYARKRMDIRDDKMLQIDPERRHSFNTVDWTGLELEKDLTAPPEEVDMSEMTVDPITKTIDHVGQEDYSAFIDAGEYIIATNPYAGFKARYDAYKKAKPSAKPLRYVLVTHHHDDRLASVTEASQLGAIIVGTPMTIKVIEADDQYASVKTQTLSPQDKIGPVDTYIVPSSHAAEYVIIYMPERKVLYQDDHYYPAYVDGPSYVNQAGLVLRDRVQTLGLDVEVLLSGHARKAEKWSDFEIAAMKQTLGIICARDHEICMD